jgi:hypothetical protein
MRTRILPSPDLFASCPLDGKILEFYAGIFDSVYISLNPFIKPIGIDKADFKPGTYPSRTKIVTDCKPISWFNVEQLAELPSLAAVDIGLRTRIGGLRKDLENQSYAAAIDALIDTHCILPPPEGMFSDLTHDKILQSIQGLGYEWLWVGNELCTERKLHWIDDLKNQGNGPTRGHVNLFTPDKELLWTVHWDSHFSFLCSSEENLAAIQNTSDLEGFLCTPSTEVYWSVRS